MAVTRGLRLDQVRAGGIEPHLDDSIYGDRSVEAVAQLSLCLSGHRWLSGQRLPVAFRNADGTFDVSRYEAYTAYDGELYTSIRNGREPRSRVLVHAGDLALFGHHPLVTLHAVTHDGNEESVARLLTWRAVKQG
jgi:hypothetical protein